MKPTQNGGGQYETWSLPQLEAEAERYSGYFAMAVREVNAGNERMRPFLEGWFSHLTALRQAVFTRTLADKE